MWTSVTPADASPGFRPLRRVEYERLVEMGAFEDEKLELLEGVLVAMSPQGVPHAVVIKNLDKTLQRSLGDRADVRVQMPIVASDTSLPVPDVAIVPAGDDVTEHPKSAYLIVEVAESSASRDLGAKARIHAKAGFPEFWVLDLAGRRVFVHRAPDPAGERYTRVAEYAFDTRLTVEACPDVSVVPSELLPH